MYEMNGKYTSAKIFTGVENTDVTEQTLAICNHPIFKDCEVRIMPDCHKGKGCTIGFTAEMPKNGEIIPNIIGVDQFCGMRWKLDEEFETIHNYIGQDGIIRKGAISCNKNEKVLIPLNMADGSLICIGKGNSDWNNSAPHGAGRALSRTQAKDRLTMQEYKNQMKDIFSSCISTATLDESPSAYKNSNEIIQAIAPTAEIIDHLKPLYNFKAKE